MSLEEEYNRKEMLKICAEIEKSFSGLKVPIERVLGDENGVITDERIDAFAERVIRHECTYEGIYDNYDVGMPGTRVRYYKCLFYLLLRSFDPHETIYDMDSLLEEVRYMRDRYRICEAKTGKETWQFSIAGVSAYEGDISRDSFISAMNTSYFQLTGKVYNAFWSSEELECLQEEYLRQKRKPRETEAEFLRRKAGEYTKVLVEKYQGDTIVGKRSYEDAKESEREFWLREMELTAIEDAVLSSDDEFTNTYVRGRRLTVAEKREFEAQFNDKLIRWKESMSNPEKYIRRYEEFCELHFMEECERAGQNLEETVLAILREDGYNKMGNDVEFIKVYQQLQRVLHRASR